MSEEYFHSVRLDREKCRGCTNCIKHCPTEAIRVQKGKAKIINERCVDCGECIRVCPYHAKIAYTDNLANINNYKYRIALPAPAVYGQVKNVKLTSQIYAALRMLGFDEVYDVAKGADIVTAAVKEKLATGRYKKPVISSACPAVVRLIRVRFPELVDNIVDVESPMEVAARLAKEEFAAKNDVDIKEIGAFFITPCPAKVTSIRAPLTRNESYVDGAISILEIYGLLTSQLKNLPDIKQESEHPSSFGIAWANSGGESAALGDIRHLAVDGVQNVASALDEIENNKLNDLDFFEGLACTGGCTGGPLVFENGYVAKTRISEITGTLRDTAFTEEKIAAVLENGVAEVENGIEPLEIMKLNDDFVIAMRMMDEIESIYKRLPGLDCGSCGSPSCRTLAEDIVRGKAAELDCIFLLKEKVRHLADEMEGLLKKL